MARLDHAAQAAAAAALLLILLSCSACYGAERPLAAADVAARQRGDIDRALAARLAELASASPAQALEPIFETRTDLYISTTHDVTSGPLGSYAAAPGVDTKIQVGYIWNKLQPTNSSGVVPSPSSLAASAWSISVSRTLGAAPGVTKVAGLSDARKPTATITVSGRLVQDYTTTLNINGPYSGQDGISARSVAAAYVPDAELTSSAVEFNRTGTCVYSYEQRVFNPGQWPDLACYVYFSGTLVSSPARKFKSVASALTSSQPLSGRWVCKLDLPAVYSTGTCI